MFARFARIVVNFVNGSQAFLLELGLTSRPGVRTVSQLLERLFGRQALGEALGSG